MAETWLILFTALNGHRSKRTAVSSSPGPQPPDLHLDVPRFSVEKVLYQSLGRLRHHTSLATSTAQNKEWWARAQPKQLKKAHETDEEMRPRPLDACGAAPAPLAAGGRRPPGRPRPSPAAASDRAARCGHAGAARVYLQGPAKRMKGPIITLLPKKEEGRGRWLAQPTHRILLFCRLLSVKVFTTTAAAEGTIMAAMTSFECLPQLGRWSQRYPS